MRVDGFGLVLSCWWPLMLLMYVLLLQLVLLLRFWVVVRKLVYSCFWAN